MAKQSTVVAGKGSDWGAAMRQMTFAAVGAGFERYAKTTRRAAFLAEMDKIVPWAELCALIEPHYPKPGNGRPPIPLQRMLRIHFLQHWFNLSDPAAEEALYESSTMRAFAGVDLGREPAPDETTICRFRHLLEAHGVGASIFAAAHRHLEEKGLKVSTGTIVDATIIHAVLGDLLHGKERRVWGDQAYRGKGHVIREHAPRAQDFTNRRHRHRGVVDEAERVRNRTKSKVRAKVEHAIGVLKRVFGFVKVRYRGLAKNACRLIVACALANLFMMRHRLLRSATP